MTYFSYIYDILSHIDTFFSHILDIFSHIYLIILFLRLICAILYHFILETLSYNFTFLMSYLWPFMSELFLLISHFSCHIFSVFLWSSTFSSSPVTCVLTGLLASAQRQTLLRSAHGVNVDHVFGVGVESGDGEVSPGRRQPLVFGPPAAGHLVTDTVAGDLTLRRQPVDGEGVSEDLRETQTNGRIQNWRMMGNTLLTGKINDQ